MKPAPFPENEAQRQAWLDKLKILDTLEEQAYDDLTALAAHICETPIALVSLVDHDRQWFKSHHGLEARETPRDFAFCAHAILNDDLFLIEDALHDERFHDNPLATGEPHVEFYAGAPLILKDSIRVGTLCVIDDHPRTLNPSQQLALKQLSRQVVSQLELRLKIRELEKLDKAKDEFISNVSHELRTPLTAIHGSLRLLEQRCDIKPDASIAQLFDISLRNTERLMALVNDILDMAKLDSGRFQLECGTLDLKQTINNTVELNKPYCAECKVGIEISSLPEDNVTLEADEKRIQQVLSNLISNASKFTFEGDTIAIGLALEDESAIVSVTDHGPGIPAGEQENLFQRFQQLDNKASSNMAGSGIGLNICKQIVELHGGKLWLESAPGVTTTFYFSLPLSNVTNR